MAVFVLDKRHRPLMPCSEKRAGRLLDRGRAVVHRLHPFTLRLKDRLAEDCRFQPLEVKIDPGSRVSGLALVREAGPPCQEVPASGSRVQVLNLFELIHRGRQISEALTARRGFRRRRRGQLRYRAPRFDNRRRPGGWLAPSLQHRVDTLLSWVERLCRLAPISTLAVEVVRFDLQKQENPEIAGVEYQQGTLAGMEVREYLLEKWGRRCAYCDKSDVPLQIEHLHPRARGGTNRITNLTLACQACNQAKDAMPVADFLAEQPQRLARIQAQAKRPLKDAAAVNATRWALFSRLQATGLTVRGASGGRTKFNRTRLSIPKTHALDAACVGEVETVEGWQRPTLGIKATGRGSYQRTRLNAHGFPRGYLTRRKRHFGFQTGDRVRAEVPTGKKAGTHTGRVAVRATGSFNIQTPTGVIQGIHHRHCRLLARGDGYAYHFQPNPTEEKGAGQEHGALRRALCLPGLKAGVSRAN
jgi:5-methylcytosine-specific restriction endonuclease McrA